MRKSRRRALVAVLVALGLILGLAGYLVVSTLGSGAFVTELPFEKPESLVFHERLAEYLARSAGTSSDTIDQDLEHAAESLARWRTVFAIVGERQQDPLAREEIDKLLEVAPAGWKDEDKADAAAIVAENIDLIERTREAVELGGPIDLVPMDTRVATNLSLVVRVAKLVCLRIRFHADRGDHLAALSDVLLGMEIAEQLAEEPGLLSHIVCASVYGMTTHAACEAFPPGTIEPRQVNKLLACTTKAHHREAFAQGLRSEAIETANRYVESVMSTTRPRTSLQASLDRWSAQKGRAGYIQAITPLIQVADLPYHEAAPTVIRDTDSSAGPLGGFLPSRDNISQDATRMAASCFVTQAVHEATIDLFRMGLLIEQHYTEHGSYPASLDVLARALGGAVPLDPFSGEPYQYVVSDDGFLLYSVGGNQVDDGGVHDQANGDWVWRGE